ncbi:MAG: hypothetical protein BA863_11290 [Desulfovibrio sp. S3730MH75]|nr:MAG: hypothetical protein BA863_11290 [Desulfovibrio sp. S3730MH75]
MSIRIQEQVLYEISMSLGNSIDLEKMLNEGLSMYLRRLCCMAGVVVMENKTNDGKIVCDQIYSIPRKWKNKSILDDFLKRLSTPSSEEELKTLRESLPLHEKGNNDHYYLMDLPGLGFLAIGKGRYPFSLSLLKSLEILNKKLSNSIISCLTHQQNALLNSELKSQIDEREKTERDLHIKESRYRAIFENSPLGMIFYDSRGEIIDCNQKYIELMGSCRDKLIGFNTAQQSSEKMRNAIKKALTGEVSVYEDYYTSVTGNKTIYMRKKFNPVSPGMDTTEVIATVEELEPLK